MRRGLAGLLLSAVLVLAGCSDGAGPGAAGSGSATPTTAGRSASPSGPATPPATPVQTAPPPDHARTGDVLVEFGRQGGFAGLSDQLTVRGDGSFTLNRAKPRVQRSGRLTPGELADLRRVLAESGFAQLPKVEPAQGTDLFTYQVIYDGNQILAMDGGIAPPLRPVISMLTGIVSRYGS
jgi:hypothetical protein